MSNWRIWNGLGREISPEQKLSPRAQKFTDILGEIPNAHSVRDFPGQYMASDAQAKRAKEKSNVIHFDPQVRSDNATVFTSIFDDPEFCAAIDAEEERMKRLYTHTMYATTVPEPTEPSDKETLYNDHRFWYGVIVGLVFSAVCAAGALLTTFV